MGLASLCKVNASYSRHFPLNGRGFRVQGLYVNFLRNPGIGLIVHSPTPLFSPLGSSIINFNEPQLSLKYLHNGRSNGILGESLV